MDAENLFGPNSKEAAERSRIESMAYNIVNQAEKSGKSIDEVAAQAVSTSVMLMAVMSKGDPKAMDEVAMDCLKAYREIITRQLTKLMDQQHRQEAEKS